MSLGREINFRTVARISSDLKLSDWLLKIRIIPDADKVEPFGAFTIKWSESDLVECARTSLISVRDINSLWVFPDELLQANKKYD